MPRSDVQLEDQENILYYDIVKEKIIQYGFTIIENNLVVFNQLHYTFNLTFYEVKKLQPI
jgi:hypothetical protein